MSDVGTLRDRLVAELSALPSNSSIKSRALS